LKFLEGIVQNKETFSFLTFTEINTTQKLRLIETNIIKYHQTGEVIKERSIKTDQLH